MGIFSKLKEIDENCYETFFEVASGIFRDLSDKKFEPIKDLIRDLPNRPDLLEKCERLVLLKKLVLADEDGYRLRFHIFNDAVEDLPHNHRFPFTAMILKGGYRHFIYGSEAEVKKLDGKRAEPLYIREERAGSIYTISEKAVHCAVAEPGTISLMIRGEPKLETALITDPGSNSIRRHHGAATRSSEIAAKDTMPYEDVLQLLNELESIDFPRFNISPISLSKEYLFSHRRI